MANSLASELRALVVAAAAGDSALTLNVLADAGIHAMACSMVEDLSAEVSNGAGVVLIAEEMLFPHGLETLKTMLRDQPPWSDLPVVVLTRGGDMTEAGFEIIKALEELRNVTLLDRPVRIITLLSVVRAALKTRQRQYEMRELLQKYKESSEAAEAASRAKSAFLANMSHEIRTPLNSIMGFGELFLDPSTTSADRAEFVKTIQRNGQLLTKIIDEILDLSKVEAGKLTLEKIRTSLPELVNDVIHLMRLQGHEKGIDVTVQAATNVPGTVVTDPTRLKQILLNIVGNAVKFTHRGQVAVTISVRDGGNGRRLCFSVKDTGRGLTPEQRTLLFEPFSQADSSTTRRFGGTGLGLILSRRLAEALGGRLELVESAIGVGSTFVIEVGLEEAEGLFDTRRHERQVEAHQEALRPVLRGTRILVAEDAPDNQFLIRQMLRRGGAEVSIANDGQEAVAMALDQHFDLILMDVHMPIKDGLEATAELRRQGYGRPIIALSAAAMAEDSSRALEAGCVAHVTKPISMSALISILTKFIRDAPGAMLTYEA